MCALACVCAGACACSHTCVHAHTICTEHRAQDTVRNKSEVMDKCLSWLNKLIKNRNIKKVLDEEALLVFTLALACLNDLDRDEWGILNKFSRECNVGGISQ